MATKLSFKGLLCYLENYPFLKTTCVLQKRFLQTETLSAAPKSSPFTLQYLMHSCGLPYETALSTSKKLKLKTNSELKGQSVITLLKSHQFSNDQIAKLILKRPLLLLSKTDTNLEPKLQYLIDNGFVGPFLPKLIVSNPFILGRSLTGHIKPSIDFLRTYLNANDQFVAAVGRSSWLITFDLKKTMEPNVEFLLSEGVPRCNISKLMILQPRILLFKFDSVVDVVKIVKSFGHRPDSPMFVRAVRVMFSMSASTWKRKVELFKSLGWSDEDIASMFKRFPNCIAGSEEKIKNLTDFYVNTMKMELSVIVAYPKLLMYAKDKRILPRHNVIEVLKSKKLLKKDKKVAWMFTLTEKDFLDLYVIKHLDQVPGLMDLYHGVVVDGKIDA